jgi:hypothetical protein
MVLYFLWVPLRRHLNLCAGEAGVLVSRFRLCWEVFAVAAWL